MQTGLRRKLNSILVSILTFEVDEWNAIDFNDSPVSSVLRQGNIRQDATITYDELNHRVVIEFDLSNFTIGPAFFDVRIGVAVIPSNYNVKLELFKGVA